MTELKTDMRGVQEILESDVCLGVKRAAVDPPDDTGSGDPQDDDDANGRMALAAAVQEELDFMRQLKVYPEVPADLVLKAGESEEFEAFRLLLRRYEPQTTTTTVMKLVELLSTQFAGNLLDCVTDFECVMASKTNVLRVAIVHDCQAKAERLWMTKNLTETILKDLDSQPYNAKQLVDNMNKNKVLKQILIKEKVNTRADLQRQINALRLSPIQSQKKRTLLEKKFTHGSETTSLHKLDEFNDVSLENLVEKEKDNIIELDETSLKDLNVQEFNVKDVNVRTNEKQNDLESYTFNVKECNAMIIETNDKKFYIICA